MSGDDSYEQRGFLQRYGFVVGGGVVLLVIAGLVAGQMLTSKGRPRASRMPEVVMIRPLPAPPPPPPPKVPEPPKETVEKMEEQTPVDPQEAKPDDAPKDAPSAVTTSLTGPGSDAFGLSGGSGGGGGGGGSSRPRSRFGWYAAQVQTSVRDALSRNRVTAMARFENKVRLWEDASGRVMRVRLEGTTGDPAVDQAIRDALTGLQFQDPPPAGMPMPIVMRLTARRPG